LSSKWDIQEGGTHVESKDETICKNPNNCEYLKETSNISRVTSEFAAFNETLWGSCETSMIEEDRGAVPPAILKAVDTARNALTPASNPSVTIVIKALAYDRNTVAMLTALKKFPMSIPIAQ